jgi:Nucleotidyl transferase AbiEii toxin, Type IV TA system
MKDVFEILSQTASERGIGLLVVGGHAMQAYGSARQTLDADFLVSDVARPLLSDALAAAGFQCLSHTINFARFRHAKSEMQDVDFLFVDDSTLQKMIAGSLQITFGSSTLRVPGLPHLIALKLHAMKNDPGRRARDLADIVDLLRLHPHDVSESELAGLCERYGPAGGNQGEYPMTELNLPRFEIPKLSPKPLSFEEYCRWVNVHVRQLLASGEYASIRDKQYPPAAGARFRL